MSTIGSRMLLAATVTLFAACGGSGTGDVTIATDGPPTGAMATAARIDPGAADVAGNVDARRADVNAPRAAQ